VDSRLSTTQLASADARAVLAIAPRPSGGLSALLRLGHRIRIAIAGNDASCFSYHGPPGETFTLALGHSTHLDLPVERRQGQPLGGE